MKADIINKSRNELPKYAIKTDSGLDLRLHIEDPETAEHEVVFKEVIDKKTGEKSRKHCIVLKPLETTKLPTGLYVRPPKDLEGQVRPKSGLTLSGFIVWLGTVDEDYTGELNVICTNLTNEDMYIPDGSKIAQLVFMKPEKIEWNEVLEHPETIRGEGGFGHTGD